MNQKSVKKLSFYRFRSKGLTYEEFSWNFSCIVVKIAILHRTFLICSMNTFYFLNLSDIWAGNVKNFTSKFLAFFFQAAFFVNRRTFSAKFSIWKENYAFCHFSTLVKKSRAFQGKLSAWLSKLPSTYVNNSLFWGERRFPKIFLYHFRVRAENVLIFSEVVFWTVVETATYISSAPFWCLFWKFFFSDLLCLWATNVRKFGAIKSDQLSNCLLRVQTSIPRWNWYLEKNFYFFMTFGPQA